MKMSKEVRDVVIDKVLVPNNISFGEKRYK